MAFQLRSPAFDHEDMIPEKYTCDGDDVSPPLEWEGTPGGTQSMALICDDPDAPLGTWIHWVIYNIPPEGHGLPEGVPHTETLENGAQHGKNSWRKIGYGGPCPPGRKPHRYYFRLYALDIELSLRSGVKKKHLLKAMDGHIVAETELMGTYTRKR